METVRDRMWLWGHEAGSHDTGWDISRSSRITPVEAAFYMDVPNMIMVRYHDKPEMPFDQYAIPFRRLKQVFWSVVGGAGRSSDEERKHVLELATRNPNIIGVFMDDFFKRAQDEGDTGVLSVDALQSLSDQLTIDGRRLGLGVTLYTHQLGMDLTAHLNLCDWVSLWTWEAPDLKDLEENMTKCEQIAPDSRKLLGLYMYDYGLHVPMPLEAMQMQCETALRWLHAGRIEGMIFLASCICDMELETVEWTREWIAKVGDELLG